LDVRACVVFNPTARGDKARRFRKHLDEIAKESTLKLTTAAGDARRLAAQAVAEGFDTIVAAGGDGTLNEVVNGIGDAPQGFDKARLAVLPLGTVNVFARELGLPTRLEKAWEVIRQQHETRIDLPKVTAGEGNRPYYFAQLAGAGLDARAIELVKWQVKKAIGPLAYVLAGLHAVLGEPCTISAEGGGKKVDGELVMIGNGRFYGGTFNLFPQADLRDGLLEVCVVPRVNIFTLARCGPALLVRRKLPKSAVKVFQADSLTLTSSSTVPVQVDGELVGHLPAKFTIQPTALRVIVPRNASR
jgi:diacylglycerol kinase (ATP)